MALVKKIKTEFGELGIWKLSETSKELKAQFLFSKKEQEEFDNIKAERRKREYLAARLTLENLLSGKPKIAYLKSGKPILKNNTKEISITHSAELVAVLISEQKSGIDAENIDRNIDKVANRFLHKEELNTINNSKNPQIGKVLYWSAKEAIFKCTNLEGIQFNEQIFIPPFEIKKEGSFKGCLNNTDHFNLWYFFYENNVIVYCVEL
jgi:4'-phosphopantetheinyl transferase